MFSGVIAAARTTKSDEAGCHNSNVMLDCKYFAESIKSGVKSVDLQWRVKDVAANKWKRIAIIKRGNPRLYAYPHLDNRTTLHANGSLEIHSLKPDDATQYMCKVSQIGKRDTHFIELKVQCGKSVRAFSQSA